MIILPANITSTCFTSRASRDVILAGKDIAIVFWYEMRCTEFLLEKNGIPIFGIGIPI
jgi:hypothetical protein